MTKYTVEIEIPPDCDIEQAGETVTIDVDDTEYVLAAARSAGIWLPADCQQGWCTICAARLVSGTIDQSHSKRYYEVDGEAGFALICTARPRSALRIHACQHEAMLDHRAAHDLPPGSAKQQECPSRSVCVWTAGQGKDDSLPEKSHKERRSSLYFCG